MDKLLEERLDDIQREVKGPIQGRSVPLYANVSPLDIVRVTSYSTLKGKIRQVSISWPDGCDFIVLVAFGRSSSIWLVPGEPQSFERNNDTTVSYPLDEPVGDGEALWMIVRNGDKVNPHQISVTATIVGVEEIITRKLR